MLPQGLPRLPHPGNDRHQIIGGKGLQILLQVGHQGQVVITEVAHHQPGSDRYPLHLGQAAGHLAQQGHHVGVTVRRVL